MANFLSISYSSNPIENPLNKVNYEGPMGHIMANVGETGGPSAYGTFDQNGNVEEWTNTINDKKIRVCGGYAGCDLSLLDAKFRDDFEDSKKYRGFRVASLSNPNNLSNFLLVGDKKNNSDSNGYGKIDYDFYIAKYQVTIEEWCEFINSIASYTTESEIVTGLDLEIGLRYDFINGFVPFLPIYPYGGIPIITSDTYGLINNAFLCMVDFQQPSSFPGKYTFVPKEEHKNKPITNVSWLNALRYCNWLHNNKPVGFQTINNDGLTPNKSTTENGAYTINGSTSIENSKINNYIFSKYRLPTFNEWYKAAFYKSGNRNAGYWKYATQSNQIPIKSNKKTTDETSLIFEYDLNPKDGFEQFYFNSEPKIVLPLSNPVDVMVDWGDGNIEHFDTGGQKEHYYGSYKKYLVKISGITHNIDNKYSFSKMYNPVSENEEIVVFNHKLTKCLSFGELELKSLRGFFENCFNFVRVPKKIPNTVEDLSFCFFSAANFNSNNIYYWNVSNVIDMKYMFFNARSFNQDIGNWNVSKVDNMTGLFTLARNFNQDIKDWDVSNVTNMNSMFSNSLFDQNISSWNVSNVTNMKSMFESSPFDQNISSWNVSNVTNMQRMFSNSIFNQDVQNWDVSSVINMQSMFEDSLFNQNIGSWNVGNVVNMESMFEYSLFNQDIRNWDVSSVTNMQGMFFGSIFNNNIGSWNVSNVTNMSIMFRNSIFNQDINNWNVSKVDNMQGMFSNSIFNQNIGDWDVSNVTNMNSMFADSLFNQDIRNWDVSSVTNMSGLFGGSSYNYEIHVWNTSNVENMSYMFSRNNVYDKDLSNLDVSKVKNMNFMFRNNLNFNQDITNWNTSNLLYMAGMFYGASSFNQDISILDTSNVTSMSNLLNGATSFDQNLENLDITNVIDIGGMFSNINFSPNIVNWDVSNINFMYNLFENNSSFNENISNWDVSSVINMQRMFKNSNFNQNIGNWNVSNVTYMNEMFENNISFNQDLSNWCVLNILIEPYNFDAGAVSWILSRPIWGTCP